MYFVSTWAGRLPAESAGPADSVSSASDSILTDKTSWSVENDLKYKRIPKVLEESSQSISISMQNTAQIYFLMDLDNLFVIIEILESILLYEYFKGFV